MASEDGKEEMDCAEPKRYPALLKKIESICKDENLAKEFLFAMVEEDIQRLGNQVSRLLHQRAGLTKESSDHYNSCFFEGFIVPHLELYGGIHEKASQNSPQIVLKFYSLKAWKMVFQFVCFSFLFSFLVGVIFSFHLFKYFKRFFLILSFQCEPSIIFEKFYEVPMKKDTKAPVFLYITETTPLTVTFSRNTGVVTLIFSIQGENHQNIPMNVYSGKK